MPKPRHIVTEYRNYYLPVDFPLLLLTGEHWKISDIPSSRLHFHNCLEIGVCHSWGGTMKFYSNPLRFKAGDVTCVPRNIPHTTWSDKGDESLWSYLYLDPQIMFRDMLPPSEGEPDLSLSTYQNIRHILPKNDFSKIYALVMDVIEELNAARPNYKLCVKGLLLALCIELNRIQEEENASAALMPPPTEISVPENALVISPALNYIEDNYATQFSMEKLAQLKQEHPQAKVLAHPECRQYILNAADVVGSTQALLDFAVKSDAEEFIVATESGILHEMRKRCPHKTFIPVPPDDPACACNECNYMRLNTLQKLYDCLDRESPEITVDPDIRERAVKPILRMMEMSR